MYLKNLFLINFYFLIEIFAVGKKLLVFHVLRDFYLYLTFNYFLREIFFLET